MLILSSKHGCFPEGGSLFLILLLVLLAPGFSRAQEKATSPGGRIIVCMIQLEHADAEHLATVLKPFISPQGSIVPYKTTNTLIIKDRAPVVNMLAEIIKGEPCTPSANPSDVEAGEVKKNTTLINNFTSSVDSLDKSTQETMPPSFSLANVGQPSAAAKLPGPSDL